MSHNAKRRLRRSTLRLAGYKGPSVKRTRGASKQEAAVEVATVFAALKAQGR